MQADQTNLAQRSPKPCALSKALVYENAEVVQRFTQQFEIRREEAEDIFRETKRWLWLASQVQGKELSIIGPLLIIDEMWHNFVLFTLDYTRYCMDCYGRFIHHAPTTQEDKMQRAQALAANPAEARQAYALRLQRQCSLIATKLGGTTLLKWYVEYPTKYGEAFFNTRRKPLTLSYGVPPSLLAFAAHVRAGRIEIGDPGIDIEK